MMLVLSIHTNKGRLVSPARLKLGAGMLAILSLALIALGAYVRATGAGLACPDWPLCYGRVIPEFALAGVLQEVGHRYLAGVVSLLICILSAVAYVNRKHFPHLWRMGRALILVLVIQVILGGLTVLLLLNPFIVTAHLGLGSVVFQLTALLALEKVNPSVQVEGGAHPGKILRLTKEQPEFLSKLTLIFAAMVYAQILLGGFVGSSGASLVCPNIPHCSVLSFFGVTASQNIQMLHRVLGVTLAIAALFYAYFAPRLSGGANLSRRSVNFLAALALLQIFIGFLNVHLLIPVHVTLTHLVLAQLILLTVLRIYFSLNPDLGFLVRDNLEDEPVLELPTKRGFMANFR